MRGAPQTREAQAVDAPAGAARAGGTRVGGARSDVARAAGARAAGAQTEDTQADRYPLLVAGLTAGVATVGATIFAISPLLPDIAARFGIGAAEAGRLVAVFGLAMAIVAPLVGLFARRLPRATVIVSGLLLFALAWLAAGHSERFETLLAFTLLAGAATGAVIPATYAYAGDLSSYEHRSRVMGRIVSGWPIAILLIVPLMSLAAQRIGWQLAFAALAVAALASAATIAFAPRPAASRDAQHGTQSDAASVLASLRRVFAHRATRIVLLVDCIDMGAFYAVYAFLGAEMRRVNEWGAAAAGLAIAAYGLGLLVVTLNGRFIDRAGKGRSAVLSLYALGAILAVLPWSVAVPPLLVAAIVAWGCVQGVFFTAITSLATEQIPALRGVVTAMLSGATYLGVTLFTPVGVQLYERAGFAAVGVFAAASCLVAGLLLRASPAAHSR